MSFMDEYNKSHTHPVNRLMHSFGIPLIVLSVVLFIVDILFWNSVYMYWCVGVFIFGWILQFIGHFFEGKPPAFFSNPIYLVIGPMWWILKILGIQPKKKQ